MARILLVEDNKKYSASALAYLVHRDTDVEIAEDYSQASDKLQGTPQFDGVISDVFFPFEKGSGNIAFGKVLVERMAKEDPQEREMQEALKIWGEYVNLKDLEMLKYSRYQIASSQGTNWHNSPLLRAIRQVSGVLNKEGATLIAKRTLEHTYDESRATEDYFGALREEMEADESSQPLGILVAERANELRIPVVLATSTYHHDILTQPVQNFVSRKGIRLIDCGPNRENDKVSAEYWAKVYKSLETALV